MAITINGSGTISGISAGGLPDGSVTTDDLASGAVTAAKLASAQDLSVGTLTTTGGSGGPAVTIANGGDLRFEAISGASNAAIVFCDNNLELRTNGSFLPYEQCAAYGVTNANVITVNTGTPTAIASVTITPHRANSRILVIATGDGNPNQAGGWHHYRIDRDSTQVGGIYINENAGGSSKNCPFSVAHIDHPNTTSAVTYHCKVYHGSGSFTFGEVGNIQGTTIVAMEIL